MRKQLKSHNGCDNSVTKSLHKHKKRRYKTRKAKWDNPLFYAEITKDEQTQTKVRQEKILDTQNKLLYDTQGMKHTCSNSALESCI